jgi:hypothetical protein
LTAVLLALLALLLSLAFIAAVIVGFPSLVYMGYLWLQLERELVAPKPFSFVDANLIWNPIPDRYTLKGRELIPVFLKWQRVGLGCLVAAAVTGPTAMWLGKVAA